MVFEILLNSTYFWELRWYFCTPNYLLTLYRELLFLSILTSLIIKLYNSVGQNFSARRCLIFGRCWHYWRRSWSGRTRSWRWLCWFRTLLILHHRLWLVLFFTFNWIFVCMCSLRQTYPLLTSIHQRNRFTVFDIRFNRSWFNFFYWWQCLGFCRRRSYFLGWRSGWFLERRWGWFWRWNRS